MTAVISNVQDILKTAGVTKKEFIEMYIDEQEEQLLNRMKEIDSEARELNRERNELTKQIVKECKKEVFKLAQKTLKTATSASLSAKLVERECEDGKKGQVLHVNGFGSYGSWSDVDIDWLGNSTRLIVEDEKVTNSSLENARCLQNSLSRYEDKGFTVRVSLRQDTGFVTTSHELHADAYKVCKKTLMAKWDKNTEACLALGLEFCELAVKLYNTPRARKRLSSQLTRQALSEIADSKELVAKMDGVLKTFATEQFKLLGS